MQVKKTFSIPKEEKRLSTPSDSHLAGTLIPHILNPQIPLSHIP